MAHETAVAMVNTMHTQLAVLVRGVIQAVHDKRITPTEGMMLGMQAMNFATTLLPLLEGASPEVRLDLLYVLEHGMIVLPENGTMP
jgi:hypothetical protein